MEVGPLQPRHCAPALVKPVGRDDFEIVACVRDRIVLDHLRPQNSALDPLESER